MDTSGIEPDPSRKSSREVLSERDNQLHHVPSKGAVRWNSGGGKRDDYPDYLERYQRGQPF
jgi:hypothetical protein